MNITCTSGLFFSSSVQPQQTLTFTEPTSAQMAQSAEKILQEFKNRQPNQDRVELSGQRPSGVVMLEPLSSEQLSGIGQMKMRESKETTQFTSAEVSETARQLSSIMDVNNSSAEMAAEFGISESQLAEHLGSIGKLIDEALSAGEITRQEYDDLNKGLEEYGEAIMTKAERSAAGWELAKEISKATRARIESGASTAEMAEYAKNLQENYQNMISEFVKSSCSINRSLMTQLTSRVRGGESLFAPGTEQVYGRSNVAGYFKNGYVPAKPTPYL
ncbi:MAG: hypothetical protein HDT14_00580 [Oscillibacter sp.]|nr:hypothetical protein [Oscillibacter sp.]